MRWAITAAGIGGAVTVSMGAWAAHAGLGETARNWVQTGAQYGLWHSIALLALAATARRVPPHRLLTLAAAAFAAGLVLFSGSLFLRALLDWTWVSKATPAGGLAFIAGWLLLAVWGATRRD